MSASLIFPSLPTPPHCPLVPEEEEWERSVVFCLCSSPRVSILEKKVPTERKHSVSLTRQNFISVGDFDHLLPLLPFLYAAPRFAAFPSLFYFVGATQRKKV